MTDSPTWIQEMLAHLKRTPEYLLVQHYDVTTSLFLFACLEIAIGKRQGHFIDELLMGEKISHEKIRN